MALEMSGKEVTKTIKNGRNLHEIYQNQTLPINK